MTSAQQARYRKLQDSIEKTHKAWRYGSGQNSVADEARTSAAWLKANERLDKFIEKLNDS